MSSKISQKQAEQSLAAIKAQFAAYLEPLTLDSGTVLPGDPAPTLVEDWNGEGWAICWEEGPDDWTYLVNGGVSETESVMYADASLEFGVTIQPKAYEPAKFPKGVWGEPYNSFTLCLYPE